MIDEREWKDSFCRDERMLGMTDSSFLNTKLMQSRSQKMRMNEYHLNEKTSRIKFGV